MRSAAGGPSNFILANGDALFARCDTKLCFIERRAPFGKATLKDHDVSVDFGAVTTPRDRVAVVATAPLTVDEVWTHGEPGTLSGCFARAASPPRCAAVRAGLQAELLVVGGEELHVVAGGALPRAHRPPGREHAAQQVGVVRDEDRALPFILPSTKVVQPHSGQEGSGGEGSRNGPVMPPTLSRGLRHSAAMTQRPPR